MTTPNYNPTTNTHYGCIRLNDLDPELINELYDLPTPDMDQYDDLPDDYLEGVQATIDDVTFEVFLLGGAYHLMILDSPVWGYFAPCSPCVPNAGDLSSPEPKGIRTYSIPHTWFHEEV